MTVELQKALLRLGGVIVICISVWISQWVDSKSGFTIPSAIWWAVGVVTGSISTVLWSISFQ